MTGELIILVLLLALSAFFSSAETALFSIDSIRVQTMVRQGAPQAKTIQKLLEDHRLLLGTILVGNNAANVAASALTTVMAIERFGDAAVGIAAGVLTLVVLVFSEFLPKSYAAHSNERLATLIARPMFILTRLLRPFVRVLDGLTHAFMPKHDGGSPMVGEDEIKTAAYLGVKAGTLEEDEKEMIESVLLFNDITSEDVMTPEEEVEMLDGDAVIADVLRSVNEGSFSRYPVYEGDDDNIIGVVHIRDILGQVSKRPEDALRSMRLKEICTPAMYVPETKRIDDLLRMFQKKHMHMAMVVNEYGTTVGLVTIEDLLEELVGEISDESDVDEYIIKRVDKHTVIVAGDTQVSHINDYFNTKIDAPPNKTIGRIILELLGDLPHEHQEVVINDKITAIVEHVADHHIQKVRLIKKADHPPRHE